MKEVQNKWSTLKMNDDIWAKLIYFEQNRRLAKAYVSAPMLTIDGSTNGLDGFRIGLSGIDNEYRSLDSMACLRSIGQGIKLRIDNQGNILVRKVKAQTGGQNNLAAVATKSRPCSVFVKDWPSTFASYSGGADGQSTAYGSDENRTVHEISDLVDASYKLFDMQKFRLEIERRKLNGENVMDWRQCVSIISFVRTIDGADRKANTNLNTKNNLLKDSCWLMLINIIAIDMLKSSVCDSEPSSVIRRSALVQNHLSLSNQHKSNISSNSRGTSESLRTSSSASALYPLNRSRNFISNNRAPNVSTDVQQYHQPDNQTSSVDSDRIKKLRVTNSRYGRLSALQKDPYYRRYQSTQQISSSSINSNTIYTTFNSKFINSKHQLIPRPSSQAQNYHRTDKSTSSDHYNSTNYWNYRPLSTSNYLALSQDRYQKYPSAVSPSHTNYREFGMRPKLASRTTTQLPINSRASSLDPKNRSLSLSTFELCPQGRRDFWPIKSSIKMNYDDVDENDDGEKHRDANDGYCLFDSERNHDLFGPQQHSTSRKAILAVNSHQHNDLPDQSHHKTLSTPFSSSSSSSSTSSSNCKLDSTDSQLAQRASPFEPEILTSDQSDIFRSRKQANFAEDLVEYKAPGDGSNRNHADLEATSAPQDSDPTALPKASQDANTKRDKHNQQKVSRSSIASSSSSSGCADNDYFMSQSSSSMSSSSRSNECEMFSRQASSSGIVCSGSTSDECDDGCKIKQPKGQSLASDSAKSSPTSASDHQSPATSPTAATKDSIGIHKSVKLKSQSHHHDYSKQLSRNERRGYKIKTIDVEGNCSCCPSGQTINDLPCDFAPVEYDACDCCCCDCQQFVSPEVCSTNELPTVTGSSYDLRHASQLDGAADDSTDPIYDHLPHPRSVGKFYQQQAAGKKSNYNTAQLQQRSGSCVPRVSSLANIGEDFEIISSCPLKREDKSTDRERKPSIRKKYMNIFPRFMFSNRSSASNTGDRNVNQLEISSKNGTLDRFGNFRRTKSNQNLSK